MLWLIVILWPFLLSQWPIWVAPVQLLNIGVSTSCLPLLVVEDLSLLSPLSLPLHQFQWLLALPLFVARVEAPNVLTLVLSLLGCLWSRFLQSHSFSCLLSPHLCLAWFVFQPLYRVLLSNADMSLLRTPQLGVWIFHSLNFLLVLILSKDSHVRVEELFHLQVGWWVVSLFQCLVSHGVFYSLLLGWWQVLCLFKMFGTLTKVFPLPMVYFQEATPLHLMGITYVEVSNHLAQEIKVLSSIWDFLLITPDNLVPV